MWIPIIALEVIIATKSPLWRLPVRAVGLWALVAFLVFMPIILFLLKGYDWALIVIAVLGAAWSVVTGIIAIKTSSTGLGFYTGFIVLLWLGYHHWLSVEFSRSYFDPRMKWYEGRPRAIPGVLCEVSNEKFSQLLEVSRLDRDGCFIFIRQGAAPLPETKLQYELSFNYREKKVRARGIPVRLLEGGQGGGFLFEFSSPDQKKEMGDFIEVLRGEGHE